MILSTIIGTKLAAVIASAVIAAGGLTGVGLAADNAAPGDALYSLDCAMERVGLGDGGVRERTQEAAKLAVAEQACEVAGVADQTRTQSQLRTQTKDQTQAKDQTRTTEQAQTQTRTQDQTRTTEQSQIQLRTQTQDQTHLETSTSCRDQNGAGYKGGN